MLFGSNNILPVHGQNAYRVYFPKETGVPTSRAVRSLSVPAGVTPIISFRPDAAQVISGSLDNSIRYFFHNCRVAYGAPIPVAAWHEANDPDEHQFAEETKDMHRHLAGLAAGDANVLYGAIAGTYPVQHYHQDLSDWIPNGMDWIGLDGYKENSIDTAETVFSVALGQVDKLAHRVLITETNTLTDMGQEVQDKWLREVTMYATENALEGLLVYSNHPGTTLPPAPSSTLLAELAVMAATAGIVA